MMIMTWNPLLRRIMFIYNQEEAWLKFESCLKLEEESYDAKYFYFNTCRSSIEV